MMQELEQSDRRKDEFLAMLAHELRNPLAPIRTAAELLRLAPGDQVTVGKASVSAGHAPAGRSDFALQCDHRDVEPIHRAL
ncbi:hypothetical protein JI752_016545 [Lysobacter sp. MMG2]|nr:hypothetical protein [Lysobacter sp. MMG2]